MDATNLLDGMRLVPVVVIEDSATAVPPRSTGEISKPSRGCAAPPECGYSLLDCELAMPKEDVR